MRLIISTLIALFLTAAGFFFFKIWGASQPINIYEHGLLSQLGEASKNQETTRFIIITPDNWEKLKEFKTLYINVGYTLDQKWVILPNETYQIRNKKWDEIQQDVLAIDDVASDLLGKDIIFNLTENPAAFEQTFPENVLKKLQLNKTENFIFVSPYETPLKTLKEKQPTYLLGSSKPEILKLKAMEGLWLIEATVLRADIIIHPLTYYHQPFFTEELRNELHRRHKHFIVGPINTKPDLDKALDLKPLAVIVTDDFYL